MATLTQVFTSLADKIRSKLGTTTKYTPAQAISAIDDVYEKGKSEGTTPTQEKTVTAGTSASTVTPDSGYALSKVTVNPTPSQTKSVTATTSTQTVTPDSGKLLSSVSVNPQVHAETYSTGAYMGSFDLGTKHNYRYLSVKPTIYIGVYSFIYINGYYYIYRNHYWSYGDESKTPWSNYGITNFSNASHGVVSISSALGISNVKVTFTRDDGSLKKVEILNSTSWTFRIDAMFAYYDHTSGLNSRVTTVPANSTSAVTVWEGDAGYVVLDPGNTSQSRAEAAGKAASRIILVGRQIG